MGRLFSGPFPKAAVFDELPVGYLEWLAPLGRIFRFEPGEMLVRQDRPNEWLHIILAGQVSLQNEQEGTRRLVLLEQLGPGELVGEYGLIDQRPPACTARAITEVETLRLQHLAVAYSLCYPFREVAPTFRSALRRRIEAADRWRAMLLVGEGLGSREPSGDQVERTLGTQPS